MGILLQINETSNWGSTGRIAEGIGNKMQNEGWTSYLAYGRQANPSRLQTISIGSQWDVYLHGIRTRLFDEHGFGSKKATATFLRHVEKIQPDIIHLHNIHGYYLHIGLLFERLKSWNIPVVWTLHDCWSFTGHCAYYAAAGCRKWETRCNDCPQTKVYPASWGWDRSGKNFDTKKALFTLLKHMTIVPVSRWLAREVKKSFLGVYPCLTIGNGIDLSVFRPVPSDETRQNLGIDNRFMILGVANIWEERKRLQDFIELSRHLDHESVIVLVGLTSEQRKNLPEKIIGLERTDSLEHLVSLYSAADVVLNLSVEETFGMTTIEGFGCGTPGIVYNRTASPELIGEGTGFITEPGDIEDLLHKLSTIRNKGKAAYRETCRRHASMHFQQAAQYNSYCQLYQSLL